MRLFSSLSIPLPFGSAGGSGPDAYDSLKNTGRRKVTPASRIKPADSKLKDQDRRVMSAKTAELVDNFAILAWMVNQHVNYISGLNFRVITKNKGVNDRIEEYFDDWSRRQNCHAQQKHAFNKMIRHMERQRVVDGDCFVLKIAGRSPQRGSIQIIEADRIKTPDDAAYRLNRDIPSMRSQYDAGNRMDGYGGYPFVNGVRLTQHGIAKSYALHKRTRDGTLEFERELKAANVLHHGTFERPDQVRGISPLTTSLNTLEDVYEGFRLILGKVKLNQVLGAFISRQGDVGLGAIPTEDSDGDGVPDSNYEFNFDDGINVFDLNPNEQVSVVQDNATAESTTDYLKMMIQVCLKSLDIPYSFYSEDFTNWYGARGAVIQYKRSCLHKQEELIEILDEVTHWALSMAVLDGKLQLPKSASVDDIKWDWAPVGMPWWDPQKEVAGDKAAIEAGFTSPQRVCRERGYDFEDILLERKEAQELADKHGVPQVYAGSTSTSSALGYVPGDPEPPQDEVMTNEPGQEPEEDSDSEMAGDSGQKREDKDE